MIPEKNWKDLPADQKREIRFNHWLNAEIPFDSLEAKKQYHKKVSRFIKAINLEKPDRVPVITPSQFFPVQYVGSTLKKVMYDYDELKRCWLKFLDDFEFDAFPGPGLVLSAKQLELLGHLIHQWPGNGMDDTVTMYQYLDNEHMSPDEYDDLILDPTDYLLRVFLPRTNRAIQGLSKLIPMSPSVGLPMSYINQFSHPDIRSAVLSILDSAEEGAKWARAVAEVSKRAMARGIPIIRGAITYAPFDMIGDRMRGTRGIMLDMYRRPEKLQEAMERLVGIASRECLIKADSFSCPLVFIPLHKGTGSFMSNEQFKSFYWPTLKKLLMNLIDEGLVPLLFAEGDYQPRLEIIKELPPRSVIWHFEQMDMAKAKEVLKDKACIAGNLRVSLLCSGTPQEVIDECRRLIADCGTDGGYILSGSAPMNEGDPNNLKAVMDAAKKYGRY
jgi:uroporphyrinogen-III decarboxylase